MAVGGRTPPIYNNVYARERHGPRTVVGGNHRWGNNRRAILPYNSRRLFRQRKNRKSLSKFEHLLFPIIFLWLLQCRLPRTSCPIPDILICFAIMVELFYDCVIQCKDNSHSCRLCAITQRQHFMHCAATKQRWKRDLQHIFPVRTQTIHLWMVVNAVCVHNCYYSRFR